MYNGDGLSLDVVGFDLDAALVITSYSIHYTKLYDFLLPVSAGFGCTGHQLQIVDNYHF